MSDDERELDDEDEDDDEDAKSDSKENLKRESRDRECKNASAGGGGSSQAGASSSSSGSGSTSKRKGRSKGSEEKDEAAKGEEKTKEDARKSLLNGDATEEEKVTIKQEVEDKPTIKEEPLSPGGNPATDDEYRLFMCNNNWYLFLRLHHILCERLTTMYTHAVRIAADEAKDRNHRKESTAAALRLKPKSTWRDLVISFQCFIQFT